jgi:hypothetical protein
MYNNSKTLTDTIEKVKDMFFLFLLFMTCYE